MGIKSNIEWTESTWNPVTGCTKVSPGCRNCYAERLAIRLKAMGQQNYKNGFQLSIHEKALDLPLTWKKPQTIFVNSMSDLFHRDVPLNFILKTFEIMRQAKWHNFQVLTKRAERLREISTKLQWTPNIWIGVSVENQNYTFRIDELRDIKAHIKFLSLEPLLGPLPNLNLKGINWVIVGGESGPGFRQIKKEWVINIRNQCIDANVPFFFKQWGGINKKRAGRNLDGWIWNETPKACASLF